MGKVILISGRPGIGKTTVFSKVVDRIKQHKNVGGIVTREVRQEGVRVGFQVEDIASLRRGWLAKVDIAYGPKVGRYHIILSDFERIAVSALERAVIDPTVDIIAVDELGPMEFSSHRFQKVFTKIIGSGKDILCTVQLKMLDEIRIKIGVGSVKTFITTHKNREDIVRLILQELE
ncbi:nucleoside-triphosphatase [[Eubacterium] cellulosolvens]